MILGFNEIALEIAEFFREIEGQDVLVIQVFLLSLSLSLSLSLVLVMTLSYHAIIYVITRRYHTRHATMPGVDEVFSSSSRHHVWYRMIRSCTICSQNSSS